MYPVVYNKLIQLQKEMLERPFKIESEGANAYEIQVNYSTVRSQRNRNKSWTV